MPGFYADLHVHSKYSRATSRDADLEHLALWARRKGLTVVGTGDFTHPAWFEEIRDKLVPAEPGLFRLRPEIERAVDSLLPPSCQGPTRFLLEVEISTIYKKGERTRKVHHLLYAASLDTAARMRAKLGAIGNLAADGRPILGLDSRHLLEITLESGPDAFLIPAHVWTPWFAVLGSKSGFDSVEECYGDLSSQIFAIETGLSSDPPMNWRVSKLDRFRLVSNSDAHSPPMLGREATAFDTDLDYFALRRALETGAGLSGTLEFFPEEGKYHLDGHRTCGVRLEPGATREAGGLCPACGKPLTVGVLHRVEELADRPEGFTPNRAESFRCLVPLPEVISELCGTGVKSRAVEQEMTRLITRLGPEIDILERLPLEEVARAGDGLLSEALTRLRAGKVHRDAGYDGEYGVIRLFEPGEIRRRAVVAPLFAPGAPEPPPADRPAALAFRPGNREKEGTSADARAAPRVNPPQHGSVLDALDPEQRAAAEVTEGALLLVAGPGTGKTRTLTHRLAHLTVERGVAAERCLAVTFSRRAAAEMAERLDALMPAAVGRPLVATFHGLGLRLLSEQSAAAGLAPGFRVATPAERLAIAREVFAQPPARLERLLADISRHRRLVQAGAPPPEPSSIGSGGPGGPGDPSDHAARYEAALASRNLLDFDDLLLRPLALLQDNPALVALYRERFTQISIDEYQDIDPLQYALVKLLAPPGGNLCAIGDPDQSIYSFRGADVGFFLRFSQDWPGARVLHLTRNYRSTSTLVAAACQAIRPGTLVPGRRLIAVREGGSSRIGVERAAAERAEAELVVHTLEKLLDGTSSFSFDSGRVGHGEAPSLAFSDIAILYRTEAQVPPLAEALGRAGIPFARRSHRPLAEHPGVRALIDHLAAAEETAEERTESVESRLDRAVGELSRAETAAEPAQASADLLTHLRAGAELLRSLASRSGDDLQRFLTEVALGAEIDTWDPRAERVSLLTLHAAKGLEFQVVFLVGCEDGLLPLTFPEVREADRAEERRLFFVGITRARSRLYLFHSRRRTVYGAAREARPSPFLADLADDLLELGEERAAPGPRQSQLRLLFPP
ncbi:MAG TPA: UvrD-helicase domain-containing protein [Thermoanaerobaculia bacterium]|nr:UvrD-helicase domain-containing protein [Thermoanaerobaculia bacterium]